MIFILFIALFNLQRNGSNYKNDQIWHQTEYKSFTIICLSSLHTILNICTCVAHTTIYYYKLLWETYSCTPRESHKSSTGKEVQKSIFISIDDPVYSYKTFTTYLKKIKRLKSSTAPKMLRSPVPLLVQLILNIFFPSA